MKFHDQDNALFSGLSSETKSQFPQIQVCPLRSFRQDEGDMIYVEDGLEPAQVISEVTSKKLQNLLQKNEGRFEQSLIATGKLLSNREDYFGKQYCFFGEPPEKEELISFEGPADKSQMKSKALHFCESVGKSSVVSAGDAVIEELYMNAVIDAPREAQKKGYNSQPRPSELYLCKTQSGLQISCTDSYGSLEIQKCLARMNEVYQKGVGQSIDLERTGAGAGIGCVILFEQSAMLILGVQPGLKTKVTCIIPLGVGNRVRSEMRKSIQWFQI